MSEFSYFNESLAAHQIRERVATTQRAGLANRRHRRSGRHNLATGLHKLADRLDP